MSSVLSADVVEWSQWRGVGLRVNFQEKYMALIGSTKGVVEIRLDAPLIDFLGVKCETVAISLVEPAGFLAALKVVP